jgi:hypothetical protein
MTVLAKYRSSSDNVAPTVGRMVNKSVENPANVIIVPANVYKTAAPLTSMVCSSSRTKGLGRILNLTHHPADF